MIEDFDTLEEDRQSALKALRARFKAEDAEDLSQDAVTRYLTALPADVSPGRSRVAWLITAGGNVGRNELAHAGYGLEVTVDPSSYLYTEAADTALSPDDVIERDELLAALRVTLKGLDESEVAVYRGSRTKGVKVEDVCRKLGISAQTYNRKRKYVDGLISSVVKSGGGLTADVERLIRLYDAGEASEEQAQTARAVIVKSPAAARFYSQLLRARSGALLLLPPLAIKGGLFGGLSGAFAAVKAKLFGGSAGVASSGGAAAVGGGGGGVLAVAGGSKAVAGCLVVGAACIGGGVVATQPTGETKPEERPSSVRVKTEAAVAPTSVPVDTPSPADATRGAPAPRPSGAGSSKDGGGKPGHPRDGGKPGHPEESTPAPATATETTQEEFDPLAAPAASAPVAPAPAPAAPAPSAPSPGAGSATDGAIAGNEWGP